MNTLNLVDWRNRISWRSVIAGVVTAIAISILLSLLSTSIGLFMLDPLDEVPLAGIGAAVGIWSILILLISMIAGGYVAGRLAGIHGMAHGFLVWGTSLILAILVGACVTAGALNMATNTLGAVSSVAGNAIAQSDDGPASGTSVLTNPVQRLFGGLRFQPAPLKGYDVPQNVRNALARSGIKELQPGYLQTQMDDIRNELGKAVKNIVKSPQNTEQTVNQLSSQLKKQASLIGQPVNRNDLVKIFTDNSNMSRGEAEQAADQYAYALNNAKAQAKQSVERLEQNLQRAAQDWKEMKPMVIEAAQEATNAAARSALISFFVSLIAAILCCFAGAWGSRATCRRIELQ